MTTSDQFDDAPDTVPQTKGAKTYDGCPCGSVVFIGAHIVDDSDGRIYNRCKQCNGLVRSHYRIAASGYPERVE